MGNSDSRKTDGGSTGIGLTASEASAVSQAFGEKISKTVVVSRSRISDAWSTLLTETALRLYAGFVFGGGNDATLDRFVVPYVSLVNNVGDNPAGETLIRILGTDDDSGMVRIDQLTEYAEQLFESYIMILRHYGDSNLKSWADAGAVAVASDDDDARKLARFLVNDIEVDGDKVSAEAVERWLRAATGFRAVSDRVLGAIYNLRFPKAGDSLFPEAVYPPGFRSRANIAQVFALRAMLPIEATSKWRLLFSVDLHGESWSTMLKCIMRQGPTVILIWDESGTVFGAYAPSSWTCSPQFYGDETCFLFSLGQSFVKFEPTGFNRNFQYLNTGQTSIPNGLGIGGQFDYWGLFIDSEFGNGKVSPSCSTFRDYRAFSRPQFKIVQMEVWGTGKPDPTPEELGERSSNRGGVFGSDPAAEALLEMAGKTIHSRGLRPDDGDDDEAE